MLLLSSMHGVQNLIYTVINSYMLLVLCLGDLTAQGFRKKALKLEMKILDRDLQEGKVTKLYSY